MQSSERTLDAPELVDDYYLNLLDWGSSNVLAIALGTTVYLWDASNGSTSELVTVDDEGKYVANYEESMDVLEYLFPKDKTIFLMCGGGGYAGMTKTMLVSLGWDEEKIYNTGGYWYYEGENMVEVKRIRDDGTVAYDFYKVPVHEIDFDNLTKE